MASDDMQSTMFGSKPEKVQVAGPIYKIGHKIYIPTIYALPIAIVVPLLVFLIFDILGAGSNGILSQILALVLAFSFCLTGILTRSKKHAIFLNLPVIWLVIIIFNFVFKPILGDLAYNPFGIFSILSGPAVQIVQTFGINISSNTITIALTILDLIFDSLIFFFGGWFVAGVATGLWDKKGELKIVSVIWKPIAIFGVIIFLIICPLVFHALSSATGGVGYIGAGALDMVQALGYNPNGSPQTQSIGQTGQIDFIHLNINNLKSFSLSASHNINLADQRLQDLKSNLILSAILSYFGVENITAVFDLAGAMSQVSYVLPAIYFSINDTNTGLGQTFGAMANSQQSYSSSGVASNGVTYDKAFLNGLNNKNWATANFSYAWDCGVKSGCGLQQALSRASSLKNIQSLNNYIKIGEFFNAVDGAVAALNVVDPAFAPFINGTYKTILGLSALKYNFFTNATAWINSGILDFGSSSNILNSVQNVKPVNKSINSGVKWKVYDIPLDKIVLVAKDLNTLLIPFASSALDTVKLFSDMQGMMIILNNVNMSDTSVAGISNTWSPVLGSLGSANLDLASATANISLSNNLLTTYINTRNYGLFNSTFIIGPNSLFDTIQKFTSALESNLTAISQMFNATTHMVNAFVAMGLASGFFQQYISSSFTDSISKASALSLYDSARINATIAWDALNQPGVSSSYADVQAINAWKASIVTPPYTPYWVGYSPTNNHNNIP